MPKLYEYKGIKFYFFSDEHEPVHVHAIYQNSILKVEFMIEEGMVIEIRYTIQSGHFPKNILKAVKEFIRIYKCEIVKKRQEYFYLWFENKIPNY